MHIVRTSSAAAAAAARLRLDLAPVDVLHPLLVVRGLHEGCASEAGLLVLGGDAFFASPLCPLGCNCRVMVSVLRVLVYYPVRETRMAKALSSGETSVSRPKNVTWELY